MDLEKTMRIDVEVIMPADPGTVWDLLADLSRIGEWSPECVRAAWLDDGPRVGGRFEALNHAGEWEWDVRGQVIEADRPTAFAWVVFDSDEDLVDRPSTTWRYELSAVSGGTLVKQSVRHGPGDSGVREAIRERPDDARQIVEDRSEQLRENMLTTLERMAASLRGSDSLSG